MCIVVVVPLLRSIVAPVELGTLVGQFGEYRSRSAHLLHLVGKVIHRLFFIAAVRIIGVVLVVLVLR